MGTICWLFRELHTPPDTRQPVGGVHQLLSSDLLSSSSGSLHIQQSATESYSYRRGPDTLGLPKSWEAGENIPFYKFGNSVMSKAESAF